MRIKLTAKLKSLTAFSLLAAYPPPRYTHSPMGWLLLREIMTTVYFFAKRCKSDRKVIDERNRPLTDEGVSASYKVMEILKDKKK